MKILEKTIDELGIKWYHNVYNVKRKGSDIMTTLYSSIEISKVLEDTKEIKKYYITKDEGYGFEITKSINNVEEDVTAVKNLSNNEDEVKRLIDDLIKCGDNTDQINYIVEDYLKNKCQVPL